MTITTRLAQFDEQEVWMTYLTVARDPKWKDLYGIPQMAITASRLNKINNYSPTIYAFEVKAILESLTECL